MSYLPVVALSRSQKVRLGRGVGNSVVSCVLNEGDLGVHPQTGELISAFYANLSDPHVRRDLGRHTTLGAIIPVAGVTSAHTSDLFTPAAPAVSAGTGLSVSVASFQLASRLFGGIITVPAASNLPVQANASGSTRTDAVAVDNAGNVFVVTGLPDEAVASEVDSVTTSGTPTGGTFTLSGTVVTQAGTNLPFTTAAIAFNASAATVASAVQAAIQAVTDEDVTVTGSGGPLPTAVTLTTPGVSLTGLSASSSLTGGTSPSASFTQTTQGSYGTPFVGGNVQVLATFTVANNAAAISGISAAIIPTT